MQSLIIGGWQGLISGTFWGAAFGYIYLFSIISVGVIIETIQESGINQLFASSGELIIGILAFPLFGLFFGLFFGAIYGLLFGWLVHRIGWVSRAPVMGFLIGLPTGFLFELPRLWQEPTPYDYGMLETSSFFSFTILVSVFGAIAGWVTGWSYRKRLREKTMQ